MKNTALRSPVVARPTLVDIVHCAEKEFGLTPLGNEEHFKLECALYKIEYDLYEMKSGKDEVLGYEDKIVSLTVRTTLESPERAFLTYSVKTPYLEDQLNFLRTIKTKLVEDLHKDNNWLQDDKQKTSVSKTISLQDLNEVYSFLRSHIKYRIKTF